ncbi:MAG: hypothetical protein P8X74_15685 [Reinekea sp.]
MACALRHSGVTDSGIRQCLSRNTSFKFGTAPARMKSLLLVCVH